MSISNHIDTSNIPRHIAIIMDGNGRWAQARGLPRSMGHRQGAEAAKRAVKAAAELGMTVRLYNGRSGEAYDNPITVGVVTVSDTR